MTAAWRLVPTDPFRARTRNPALALAILAHLMLLGALAASALLRVTPIPEDAFILPTVLRITLPPPPLEPVTMLNAVVPIEHDETTEPREMPLEVLPPPEPQVRFARSSSPPETRTPAPTPTGQLPRVFQPSPFSGTALVRRAAPSRFPAWWIAIGVFLLALIAAILR